MALFWRLSTQWRVGAGGREGLDYNVVFTLMGRLNLAPADWDFLFDDIQTLEYAALKSMNEKE